MFDDPIFKPVKALWFLMLLVFSVRFIATLISYEWNFRMLFFEAWEHKAISFFVEFVYILLSLILFAYFIYLAVRELIDDIK